MPIYCCLVTTLGMVCNHIVGTVGDHPDDGGWPSLGCWVTNLWIIGYPHGDGVGKWVTIFWNVGDHIWDGG